MKPWWLWYSVYFLTLAGIVCLDEVRFPQSLPLKATDVVTVPLFNTWTMGWNAQGVRSGFSSYWDAPIFFPSSDTFAFSEPQPATMIIAPIVWLTDSPVVAYKVWLLLAIALNGLVTASVLRSLKYGWLTELAAGTAVSLLPVVHQQIDVIQLVPVWAVVWFWSAAARLYRTPSVRRGLECGTALASCFALCVHHATFAVLLFVVGCVVYLPGIRRIRFLLSGGLAVTVAIILILPIVYPIRAAARANEFSRNEATVGRLSAQSVHYLDTPPNALVGFKVFDTTPRRQFCVGWFRMVLALAGVIAGLTCGLRKRWIVFLTLTGTTAFLLSLGMNLEVGSTKIWPALTAWIPGLDQVRSVYRFVWFVQLTLVLLAAEAVSLTVSWLQKWQRSRWQSVGAFCVMLVPAVLLAAEIVPERPRRGGVPDPAQHSQWIAYVRSHVPAGRSIACLPFASGNSVRDYDVTVRWMYFGLKHQVPLVNGYSGFFPQRYLTLRNRINNQFPTVEILRDLTALNVELLVVARNYRSPARMLSLNDTTTRLELVHEDPAGIDLYRLISTASENH